MRFVDGDKMTRTERRIVSRLVRSGFSMSDDGEYFTRITARDGDLFEVCIALFDEGVNLLSRKTVLVFQKTTPMMEA